MSERDCQTLIKNFLKQKLWIQFCSFCITQILMLLPPLLSSYRLLSCCFFRFIHKTSVLMVWIRTPNPNIFQIFFHNKSVQFMSYSETSLKNRVIFSRFKIDLNFLLNYNFYPVKTWNFLLFMNSVYNWALNSNPDSWLIISEYSIFGIRSLMFGPESKTKEDYQSPKELNRKKRL